MISVLDIATGLCWTSAYIAAFICGLRRRTWCIPFLAICLNFSWELLVVINRIQIGTADGIPFIIQLVWLVFDLGVISTWLLFEERKKKIRGIAVFAVILIIVYISAYRLGYWGIVVFIINVIMSWAFIHRRIKDHSSWTSLFIAVSKLLGTLAATLMCGVFQTNPIQLWLGGICLILDIYYLVTLCSKEFSGR